MATFTADPIEVVNTTTVGDQFQPSVAPIESGGYVVAWTSGTGAASAVYSQVYDAGGSKVGGETLLFQASSAYGARVGGVAGLADGSFVVSLTTGRNEGSLSFNDIYIVRADAQGHIQGDPLEVGRVLNIGTGGDYDVTAGEVYAAPDGGFYVSQVFMSRPTPVSTWFTVFQRYDAAGQWAGVFGAADGGPDSSIAVLPDGKIVSAWDVWGGPTGVHLAWHVITPDRQEIAHGEVRESPFAWDANPSVAALANGRSVVVWSHAPDMSPYAQPNPTPAGVYALVLDATGQPLGAPRLLDVPDFDVPQAPDIVALPSGGFLAYWMQSGVGGNDEYFAREFSASAQPVGEIFAIAAPEAPPLGTPFSHLPDVAVLPDGSFVLAFDAAGTGEDVYVQQFDVVGQTIEGGNGKDELRGTTAADILRGGNGKDTLFGDLGNDVLDGGNGIDTAVFTGNRSQYGVTHTSTGYTVTGLEGSDSLIDVERLQFADANVAIEDIVALIGTVENGMSSAA